MAGEAQLLRMLEPAVRPAGAPAPRIAPQKPIEQQNFDELLAAADQTTATTSTEPLKFSSHAQMRLDQMGLELSDQQKDALAQAADQAAAKGANDSLMLMQRLGLIVNIPNRTVVTVLGADRLQSGVVTKIDSTVLVNDPQADAVSG
jgi:flagellar operon protein